MLYRDRVSMEGPYDVAQTEETRMILGSWDQSRTETLMADRQRTIMANLEARIKNSVEREFLARNLIRTELVQKASNGDADGIRQMLEIIIEEMAEAQKQRPGSEKVKPRAHVEVRNDKGQSLLSIAAQQDDEELATFLLNHWKTVDADR